MKRKTDIVITITFQQDKERERERELWGVNLQDAIGNEGKHDSGDRKCALPQLVVPPIPIAWRRRGCFRHIPSKHDKRRRIRERERVQRFLRISVTVSSSCEKMKTGLPRQHSPTSGDSKYGSTTRIRTISLCWAEHGPVNASYWISNGSAIQDGLGLARYTHEWI